MSAAIPERRPATEEISGVIERVTFHNDDSGFCVLRIKTKGHREETTVVGSLPSVTAGEWLVAEGWWVRDKVRMVIPGIPGSTGAIGPIGLPSAAGYSAPPPTRIRREETMIDTLQPNPSLLCKLGSIAVHAAEMLSPGGHPFDKVALESLLSDPEVRQWIKDMGSYLPAQR